MEPTAPATHGVSLGPVLIMMAMFGVLGLVIGHRIGLELGKKAQTNKQFWLYSAGILGCGILLTALAAFFPTVVLALVFGLIAGAIAGCKHGYGQSVGLWAKHDKAFLVSEAKNKDKFKHVKTAGEKRTRTDEKPQRELMSVSPDQSRHYDKK